VDSLPCVVDAGWFVSIVNPGYTPKTAEFCLGKVTHHHTESGGTSMKGSDLSCIPLCHGHHKGLTTAIHNGKKTFARIYGVDEEKEVRIANQEYIKYLEGK
jgi:hypothetical protein